MGLDLETVEGVAAHDRALARVVEACRKTGKFPGIHGGSVAGARRRREQGFLFVTVNDLAVIEAGVSEALRQVPAP
jgi:2-keto-3-deoxy-L-rhamnonate aldolase RhmA